LAKSSTATTLQHSVQVPQARPGTTRDSASAAASGAAGEPAESPSDVIEPRLPQTARAVEALFSLSS
jgi:hypothetical protein